MDFKSGDMICQGERYVYKCREVSGPDWCNIHQMGSEYAYLAWELIDAYPEEVETIEETHKAKIIPKTDPTTDDNTTQPSLETVYSEPSYKEMLALHDPFPLL
jgi:hypothetical protein